MIRASIPSPPVEWQSFNLGEIFRSYGWAWAQFNLTIHTYAICILIGIIVGLYVTNRRLVARGVESWAIIDVVLFAVPLGIIGGRAYHVLTHPSDYFAGQDIMKTLYIWEGGMAIFGAMALGTVGAWIGARVTGIRFSVILDAIAPAMLIAQAFGRLGNYFNHELYGTPTDLPWGLEIESTNSAFPMGLPSGTLFHPTFLYEALWNILGALVITYVGRRFTLQWGRTFAVYLIWYGIGRTVIETMRLDPSETFLGIRVNVWTAVLVAALGVVIYCVQRRRHRGHIASPYMPGKGPKGNSALNSEQKYTVSELTR